jgi:hypothetical protein
MNNETISTIVVIAFCVVVLIVVVLFSIVTAGAIDECFRRKRFLRFRSDLKAAILSDRLIIEDLRHLMVLHHADDTALLLALRQDLADALSDPKRGKGDAEKFRRLITWHADEHPFSELPEDIRIQLDTLRSEAPQVKNRLRDLAVSLTEIYQKNQMEMARQGRHSFWGWWSGSQV